MPDTDVQIRKEFHSQAVIFSLLFKHTSIIGILQDAQNTIESHAIDDMRLVTIYMLHSSNRTSAQ